MIPILDLCFLDHLLLQNQVDLLDLSERESGKAQEVDKKAAEKVSALNLQVSKLKNQVSEQTNRIKDYERTLAENHKEIDASEREKRRQVQD